MPRTKTKIVLTAEDREVLWNIGQQVKLRRNLNGWTQSQLAARMDKQQEVISEIEKGTANLHIATVMALARALGATLEDMLKPTDDIRRALGLLSEPMPRGANETQTAYEVESKKARRSPSRAKRKAA